LIISSQANSLQRKGQTNGVDLVDGFHLAEWKMVKVVLYKLTADCLSTSHRSKNPLDDSVTAFMSMYVKSRIRWLSSPVVLHDGPMISIDRCVVSCTVCSLFLLSFQHFIVPSLEPLMMVLLSIHATENIASVCPCSIMFDESDGKSNMWMWYGLPLATAINVPAGLALIARIPANGAVKFLSRELLSWQKFWVRWPPLNFLTICFSAFDIGE
jgi:hypothetical protein